MRYGGHSPPNKKESWDRLFLYINYRKKGGLSIQSESDYEYAATARGAQHAGACVRCSSGREHVIQEHDFARRPLRPRKPDSPAQVLPAMIEIERFLWNAPRSLKKREDRQSFIAPQAFRDHAYRVGCPPARARRNWNDGNPRMGSADRHGEK